jgi:transposase
MWEPAEALVVSEEDKTLFEQLLTSGWTPQRMAFRARIILSASRGVSNNQLAAELGTTRTTVLKWRQRYAECGVEGVLEDAPGRGRKRQISPDKEAAIVNATLHSRPENGTHWSTRTMAAAQGVSSTTVFQIWRAHRLQPHRVETFKLSKDPQFVDKVRDVVGLYLNPPDQAMVLSVDEKSQIQALDRTQPILPLRPGVPERQTHDYQRHGTTTLFAALNVLTGKVIGACKPRHRHGEFLEFLQQIDRSVPANKEVHLILDNYGTHSHAKVREWLEERPRYHLHFTPTGASWLNLVERFFSEITERRIRRGTFHSVPELIRAILDYVRDRNRKPKPFVWVATASQILSKVKRCLGNLKTGH